MLNRKNYELEYMRGLQEKYKKDPALLERVLYAFGLLEALKVSGLPFVFKGGTCLMLLLEHPMSIFKRPEKYQSPLQEKEFYILLDILFSEIPYVEITEREVKNELLAVDGLEILVTVPSAECILGDKLTAFAPHTTGIPLVRFQCIFLSEGGREPRKKGEENEQRQAAALPK